MGATERQYRVETASFVDIFEKSLGNAGEVPLSQTQKMRWKCYPDTKVSGEGQSMDGWFEIVLETTRFTNYSGIPVNSVTIHCQRLPGGADNIRLWIDSASPGTQQSPIYLRIGYYENDRLISTTNGHQVILANPNLQNPTDLADQLSLTFPMLADLPNQIDIEATIREIMSIIMKGINKPNKPLPEVVNFGSLLVPANQPQTT